jgi:hypothetical protein
MNLKLGKFFAVAWLIVSNVAYLANVRIGPQTLELIVGIESVRPPN